MYLELHQSLVILNAIAPLGVSRGPKTKDHDIKKPPLLQLHVGFNVGNRSPRPMAQTQCSR